MAFTLLNNPHKHFYTSRRQSVKQIVLHVTAGLQDLDMEGADHSAEGTNRYGATTSRQASWHKCVDSDSIADAIPDEYTAFHCRGFNSGTLGLEISNRDARWDNKPEEWTKATLLNAAKVCLAWEKKYGIPRRLLNRSQVEAGHKGYTYHSFLDPSRRSDPGKTFPWALFVELLEFLEGDKPSPAVPTPAKPKPGSADRALTQRIQTHVEVKPDGLWGKGTDLQIRKMRTAAMSKAGYNFPLNTNMPFDVRLVQYVIDTKVDGRWGPNSQAALEEWIRGFQRIVGASIDGAWGPETEKRFHEVRNANLNNF